MTLSRQLTRPMLSSIFFVGPVTTLRDTSTAAKRAEPVTAPIIGALQRAGVPVRHDPETLVRINAGVHLAAATALATGHRPRLAASVLAISLVPTTLAGHPFWRESDPAERRRQQIELAKNASILGGLLIAALDTDGKPGRAWLARAATRRLGRQAEHLATTARLEGRIAQLEAAGAGDVLAGTLSAAASGLVSRGHDVADHVNRDAAERFLDKAESLAGTVRTAGAGATGAVGEAVTGAMDAAVTGKAARRTRRKAGRAAKKAAASAVGRLSDASETVADRTQEWRKLARKEARARTKRSRREALRARKRAGKQLDAWGATAQESVKRVRARAHDLGQAVPLPR